MVELIRNQSQRQSLDGSGSLRAGAPVGRHAGKSGDVGEPTAVGFAMVFDRQRVPGRRCALVHCLIIAPVGATGNAVALEAAVGQCREFLTKPLPIRD